MRKMALLVILMTAMLVPSASAQTSQISCMEFVNSTPFTVCWEANGEFVPLPEDGGMFSMLEPLKVDNGFSEADAETYVEEMLALDAVRDSNWQLPDLLFLANILFAGD